jgi:hypothetical protein
MKFLLLTIALLAVLSAPARAEDRGPIHVALGAYMTLNGVDLAETMYLLGAQQGHEGNPVLAPFADHPVAYGAVKIAAASAFIYTMLQLHRTHPRLTWVLTGFGIAAESFTAVHNARLLR